MKVFSSKLSQKKLIADNVVELHFEKPADFSYTAGQYLQFLFDAEGKQTPRSYSLASTPNDDDLVFCVKLLEGGLASEKFRIAEVGEEYTLRGAIGHFVNNTEAKAHTYVATGAGLAPIMGMIRDELSSNTGKSIELIFGVRSQKDVFWKKQLDELAEKHNNFSYKLTLSQPDNGWDGLSGRVTEHLGEITTDADWYLCGSGAMVMDVRKLLTQAGLDPKQIHFEIF